MAYLTILTLPLRTEWQKLEIASYKVRIAWQTHNSDKNVLHSRIKSELQEKKSIARYYIQFRQKKKFEFIFHNFKKKSEMLTIEMKEVGIKKNRQLPCFIFIQWRKYAFYTYDIFFFFLRKSTKILLNTIPPVIDWHNILIHN